MKTNILFFVIFLNLFFNSTTAFAQFLDAKAVTPAISGARSASGADLNNDERMDVVVAFPNRVSWFPQQLEGVFGAEEVISTAIDFGIATWIGDLNGDNIPDVISGSEDDGKIAWYENDGGGNFGAQNIIEDNSQDFNDFHVVDIDQDGDMDVLGGFNRVYLYINDGAGNFSEIEITGGGLDKARAVHAGDIDGDGDLDVIGGFDSSDELRWYENTFQDTIFPNWTEHYITFFQGIKDIVSEDMDNDGDMDILFASDFTDDVILFRNTGDGTGWQDQYISFAPDQPGDIEVVDFNNDGFKDILCAFAGNSDELWWFENSKSGNFEAEKITDLTASFYAFATPADINGDGAPDILSISNTASFPYGVGWYENRLTIPIIEGTVFWDENENGIKDSLELGVPNIGVQLIPGDLINFTNEQGAYRFFGKFGDYSLEVEASFCYEITSDSSILEVTVVDTTLTGVDIGLKLIPVRRFLRSHFMLTGTRCNTTVSGKLTVRNTACGFTAGRVALVVDSLADFVESVPMPDSMIGDTLWWEVDPLIMGAKKEIAVQLAMPNSSFTGDTMTFPLYTWMYDTTGSQVFTHYYQYDDIVRCSYDPNDKLTFPKRGGPNYTLFEESLFYTVRFQNTGNDTAYRVVILDTLDINLDWNTLVPFASSHSLETELDLTTGEVAFIFNDILLPDSTTNESASQGFVAFSIDAKEGLPEKTEVLNRAGIYFDFNPPIITNWVHNTLVDTFLCKDSIGLNGNPVAPLSLLIDQEDILCFGQSNGMINAAISGGIPPYQFGWNTGDSVLILDNLAGGSYTLISRDDGNCRDTIAIVITEPPVLLFSGSTLDVSCFGNADGAVALSVLGGTPPYQYEWENMQMDSVLMGLNAGVYDVTVTDVNDCQDSLTLNINEPDPLIELVNITPASGPASADGAITISSISGGTPPYSLSWSTGDTTSMISDLLPGFYTLTLTDANGCTKEEQYEVDFLSTIENVDVYPSISIYPTLFQETITIELIASREVYLTMELFGGAGQLIKQGRFEMVKGKNVYEQEGLGDLTSGIYIIRLSGKAFVFQERLIKF